MAAVAVETIAAAALRARLRSHGGVSVRLRANGWDLLAGRVEGAAVEGRLWESPLGLTARILDVEVGRVELDLAAALQQQRIALRNVPLGAARVVFSGPDFGAFLRHPLVVAAAARAVQGLSFSFDREVLVLPPSSSSSSGSSSSNGSSSNPGGGATGAVLFSGVLPATQQRYQLTMRPAQGGGRAVTVTAVPVGTAAAIPPAAAGLPAAAGAGVGAGAAAAAAAAAASLAGSPLRSKGRGNGGPAAAAATLAAAGPAGLSTASAGSVSGSSSSLASSSSAEGEPDPVVSAELSRWFSGLTVDLQGAELAFDGLCVSEAAAVAARDNARGGAGSGVGGGGGARLAARDAAEGWIDLRLKATVRDFPPLNLQF
ncbi:hypothetical protein CHLRE_03g163250v5 [Chlamydomonas reinhardtii]|uniref:Uncharacterized protein n=1 Tax=Chlamydomonas reinhardtii TaxID=3055 RepID=A0A2K3DWJ4_CHLRE|nr:uncharacterized protein CHLRE_03g163250v5 [Chlamydomonas reinhardtii]PNW84901.1 hypothetical protein CHLRE_03g163250v5 [Chlamydomonas reinhardtii]